MACATGPVPPVTPDRTTVPLLDGCRRRDAPLVLPGRSTSRRQRERQGPDPSAPPARDRKSHGGFQWPESGYVEAPDWDPDPSVSCGNSLHGLLWGQGAIGLTSPGATDRVWRVVEVDPADIADVNAPDKGGSGAGTVPLSTADRVKAASLVAASAPAGIVVPFGSATAGTHGSATAGDHGTATAGGLRLGDRWLPRHGDRNGGGGTATWLPTRRPLATTARRPLATSCGSATAGGYGSATAGDAARRPGWLPVRLGDRWRHGDRWLLRHGDRWPLRHGDRWRLRPATAGGTARRFVACCGGTATLRLVVGTSARTASAEHAVPCGRRLVAADEAVTA